MASFSFLVMLWSLLWTFLGFCALICHLCLLRLLLGTSCGFVGVGRCFAKVALCPFWLCALSLFCSFSLASAGVRFGEALHPGPGSTCTRFGITNPTCVSNKFDVYRDLLQQHHCHAVTMSETAATEQIQKQISSKFREKNAGCFGPLRLLP